MLLLAVALLPPTITFVSSRAVLPSQMPRLAQSPVRSGFVAMDSSPPPSLPSLSEEQSDALTTAAKSSKYYTPLNRPGGASSDTWAAVRGAYPQLEGLSDKALTSAFSKIKLQGAGSRAPVESASGSAFQPLMMSQKVALVNAVRGDAYNEAMRAAAGDSSKAWATILNDSPELAGLSTETLDAATAELLAPRADSVGKRVSDVETPPLSSVVVPLALVAIISLSVANAGSEQLGSQDDGRLARANSMVQENVGRWVAKNLPAM